MEKAKRNVFTQGEKLFLKEIVVKYQNIIENKKTDGSSIKDKIKCWDRVADEFNANSQNNKRTVKQLKKLWDNLKTERKKELTAQKKELFKTGGGPVANTPTLDDPTDSMLDSFATEIPGAVDSDTVALANVSMIQDDVLILECDETVGDAKGPDYPVVSGSEMYTPSTSTALHSARISKPNMMTEGKERVRRVKGLQEQDKELHKLIMEEQKYKVELVKKKLKIEEVKLNAEEEELVFKRKKWELELQTLARALERGD